MTNVNFKDKRPRTKRDKQSAYAIPEATNMTTEELVSSIRNKIDRIRRRSENITRR